VTTEHRSDPEDRLCILLNCAERARLAHNPEAGLHFIRLAYQVLETARKADSQSVSCDCSGCRKRSGKRSRSTMSRDNRCTAPLRVLDGLEARADGLRIALAGSLMSK
jgi:hypothetical protein